MFDFNSLKKEIVIEAQDPSLGQSHTVLIPEDINGSSLKISFNYRFLLDGLYSIKEDEIIIKLNKEINPGLIHGKSNDNFSYILMPIKIWFAILFYGFYINQASAKELVKHQKIKSFFSGAGSN